jgi:hypothetical protein
MNINQSLDLSLSSEYDLLADKDRSLNAIVNATFISGNTEVPFYFSGYTGATLTVKNQQGTILQVYSTIDNSIILSSTGNTFQLIKSFADMNAVRAGTYLYDMYLSNALLPRRAFLWGKITYRQNIGN